MPTEGTRPIGTFFLIVPRAAGADRRMAVLEAHAQRSWPAPWRLFLEHEVPFEGELVTTPAHYDEAMAQLRSAERAALLPIAVVDDRPYAIAADAPAGLHFLDAEGEQEFSSAAWIAERLLTIHLDRVLGGRTLDGAGVTLAVEMESDLIQAGAGEEWLPLD